METLHRHAKPLTLKTRQIFQGTFTASGYRLGRLAANLYRMHESSIDPEVPPVPVHVGYAPNDLQSLNTPEAMGKVRGWVGVGVRGGVDE